MNTIKLGNHLVVTKLLLENGANVKAEDKYGKTPLLLALANGYETIVNLLIERGANIESRDTSRNRFYGLHGKIIRWPRNCYSRTGLIRTLNISMA